ncbi:hypothetical protein CHUAL_001829 [Chamberlinius hualienensis]
MLKFFALCLVLLGAEASVTFDDVLLEEFNLFKLQYGKTYENREEEQYRMDIYINNRLSIASHNQQYHQGLVTFEMGMNKFGDLLIHEVSPKMSGLKSATNYESSGSTFLSTSNFVIPDKIDWRTNGYVTPVRDQGNCFSDWAFSATGALEGQTFKKTGNLVPLSVQDLIDCSRYDKNNGCEGGLIFKKDKVGANITNYTEIDRGNETQLQYALATTGPVSVTIDSNHRSFQFYSHGIYNEPQCDPDVVSRGVLAVGYDIDSTGQEYYIVKNTWGTKWGIDGYIWIARNKNNICGIASFASFPIV